jgi:hypothetical protein
MQTKAVAAKTRITEYAGRAGRPFLFALVLAAGWVAGAIPAKADDLTVIPPEEPPYLINPSAPGVDALEAFIETPGTSFGSQGFVNLDPGWNNINVNQDYSTEYGPASAALTEDLDVTGNTSFVADLYGFTGCAGSEPIAACPAADLTDAYMVYFTNGVYQSWAPLTAGSLSGENASPGEAFAGPLDEGGSPAPEPKTAMLIGGALFALSARRRKSQAR